MESIVDLVNQVIDQLSQPIIIDLVLPPAFRLMGFAWLLVWIPVVFFLLVGISVRFWLFAWAWESIWDVGANLILILFGWMFLFSVYLFVGWFSISISYEFMVYAEISCALIISALKLTSIGFFFGVLANYLAAKIRHLAVRLEQKGE